MKEIITACLVSLLLAVGTVSVLAETCTGTPNYTCATGACCEQDKDSTVTNGSCVTTVDQCCWCGTLAELALPTRVTSLPTKQADQL